jgi:Aspartyl protease
MTLHFRYAQVRALAPILSLGGRWVRPTPIVPVTIIGPTASRAQDGLLDTGAHDTIFPAHWAQSLGIDLTDAPVGRASVVGMPSFQIRYAQVSLRITDGVERREWPAWVGFLDARMRYPLLGFAGCLQFFTATF